MIRVLLLLLFAAAAVGQDYSPYLERRGDQYGYIESRIVNPGYNDVYCWVYFPDETYWGGIVYARTSTYWFVNITSWGCKE